jgi:hypothetical protein
MRHMAGGLVSISSMSAFSCFAKAPVFEYGMYSSRELVFSSHGKLVSAFRVMTDEQWAELHSGNSCVHAFLPSPLERPLNKQGAGAEACRVSCVQNSQSVSQSVKQTTIVPIHQSKCSTAMLTSTLPLTALE